jgi:hypothetical protein
VLQEQAKQPNAYIAQLRERINDFPSDEMEPPRRWGKLNLSLDPRHLLALSRSDLPDDSICRAVRKTSELAASFAQKEQFAQPCL